MLTFCHVSKIPFGSWFGSYLKDTETLLAAEMASSWENLVGATGFEPVTPRL